ncbi:hypothetical protein BDW02DRAFT_583748 [Decorospora gaudefroyi]|uniref:Extracellular membrane protein CFEM domain-containing protein n=1 Tax=Decorospora gaudefroyi TaxID=184978 RepID=A0A6A5JZY3_9PLEO|nr:hypothetical protein BDW02DRAFT_583748 [Decorospora gaudefroyi]
MHSLLLISALAALSTAFPYPQETNGPTTPEASLISPSAILPSSTTPNPDLISVDIPVTAVPTVSANLDDEEEDEECRTSRRKSHWEPIPIFTKKCQCNLATARYPCWATDALQSCHFEENFSFGCFMQAVGGCPTPTRICSNLFKPTPRPGRHPCAIGPNPPNLTTSVSKSLAETTVPIITTSLLSVGTLSLPTTNVTLPTVSL